MGNKYDLKEQAVTMDEAAKFAREQKMGYLEASAALNINIDKIFELLGGKVVQVYEEKPQGRVVKKSSILQELTKETKVPKKKKCCD